MRKIYAVFFIMFFSFSALASQTYTLEYKESYLQADDLGLKDSDLKELEEVLESLKDSTDPISIVLEISRAEGVDYDGEQMSSSRGDQQALLRGLRLKDAISFYFKVHSHGVQFKIGLKMDNVAPSNQAKITIADI